MVCFYPPEKEIDKIMKRLESTSSDNIKYGIMAEKTVFESIKRSEYLRDKNYCVFWDTIIKEGNGDCDFILLGEDGIFVIEVKSGKWEWDGKKWVKEGRKCPFDQAEENLNKIINMTKSIYKEDIYKEDILHASIVALPDTSIITVNPRNVTVPTLFKEDINGDLDSFFIVLIEEKRKELGIDKKIIDKNTLSLIKEYIIK